MDAVEKSPRPTRWAASVSPFNSYKMRRVIPRENYRLSSTTITITSAAISVSA